MNTPWGYADQQTRVQADNLPAIYIVSTPSHGGIGITDLDAQQYLSQAARLEGELRNIMRWYEEDCDWCILAWELPAYWPKLFEYMPGTDPKQYLLDVILRYHPVYAVCQGLAAEGAMLWHGSYRNERGYMDPHDGTYHECEKGWVCSTCNQAIVPF